MLTTVQTAFSDPRFPPLLAAELPEIRVEISVLTPSQPLAFDGPEDLLARLTPGIDGVTLRVHGRRATFLPQVWDAYPDPEVFLGLLCQKMGLLPDTWRSLMPAWKRTTRSSSKSQRNAAPPPFCIPRPDCYNHCSGATKQGACIHRRNRCENLRSCWRWRF